MYKISVIIPIYCVEKYIVRCAESLFNQTLKDIQFIFVDDASPDNSVDLLQKTIERFPQRKKQIIILYHPKNLGLPTARATGLSHVEAPYVAYCDSDDYVDPTIYSKLYENAIRNNSDMVICGRMTHYADGTMISSFDSPFPNKSFIYSFLYNRLRPSVWSKLTKTDIYRRVVFPTESFLEDWVQTAQMLAYSHNISFLNEPLYHYCIRPQSITNEITKGSISQKIQKGIVNYYLMHDFLFQHDQTLKEDDFILRKQILRTVIYKTNYKDFRKEYLRAFPEINFKLLFNRLVPLRQRVYHFSILIGLYPLIFPIYLFPIVHQITSRRLKMFNFTKRTRKNIIKTITIMSSLVLSLVVIAQTKEQANDAALLDSFIQSRGYSNPIIFSSANIKQFWIDKSVVSQDNLIKIFKENLKSIPYKIQLANVSELQDCKVDIISNRPDLMFSVLDNNLKVISDSKKENNFIHYNIASASFHLEDTNTFSFYLQISSSSNADDIAINRIILSFSDNKESHFLSSPGKLIITESNCFEANSVQGSTQKIDAEKSFSAKGKNIKLISNNKIFVSDNTLSNSVTVKNIGDTPTRVYIGYAPYTKEGKLIDRRNNPYKGNKILRVVSAEKGRNTIIVDSEPEWTKGCYLALNAKEDLSDFPNHSWVDGTIQDVKKSDNDHFEILFSEPNQKEIKAGTPVRVQSPAGDKYIYIKIKTLLPGEEANLSSEISKDDTYLEVGTKKFCRGTYYVVPLLLSNSETKENTVQISNFSISY